MPVVEDGASEMTSAEAFRHLCPEDAPHDSQRLKPWPLVTSLRTMLYMSWWLEPVLKYTDAVTASPAFRVKAVWIVLPGKVSHQAVYAGVEPLQSDSTPSCSTVPLAPSLIPSSPTQCTEKLLGVVEQLTDGTVKVDFTKRKLAPECAGSVAYPAQLKLSTVLPVVLAPGTSMIGCVCTTLVGLGEDAAAPAGAAANMASAATLAATASGRRSRAVCMWGSPLVRALPLRRAAALGMRAAETAQPTDDAY